MKTEIFEIKTGNSEKTIGDLRKELKAAKGDIANLTVGTEEYNAAVQKAADITDKLGDIQQLVQRSSTGLAGKMASVSNVMAGVSGAANTVVGTLSLLGVQNEELQKKLNNSITALIGITQGLSALTPAGKALKELTVWTKAATKGFGAMKTAILGTGIGALVIAIGTLVAYKDDIKEFFTNYNEGNNHAAKEVAKHREEIDKLNNSMKGDSGKNIWEIMTEDVKKYNEEIAKTSEIIKSNAEAEIEAIKAQRTEWSKLLSERRTAMEENPKQKWRKKLYDEALEQFTILDEEVRVKQAILVAYDNTLKKQNDSSEETVKSNNKLGSSIKKVTTIFDEFINKSKEANEAVESFQISRTFDFLKDLGFSDADITEFANRLGNDFEKIRNYLKSTYGEDYIAYLLTGEEQPIKISVEPVFKPAAESTDSLVQQANEAAAKWERKRAEEEEDAMKKRKKNYAESVQLVGSLGNAFAALSEVYAENEEASQALAISSIIADTAAAIMGTWAGYADLGIPGTIAAAIQTAAIAATGVAQIMNVKNQRISEGYTPNIPEVKTSAIQQSNYAGGEYKVYVTETDITNTQNRVRVIENQSKY